jgi:pyruvate/2-oxoglutarate dehydrogenase complex dihydrolipoamide acyltransferase (E2) component
MPQLGESVTEGTILRWLKSEGEEVAADEPLCEVETDKVTAELPSPFAGMVLEFLVEEGATVDVGVEIALLQTSESAQAVKPESRAPSDQQTASEATATTETESKTAAHNGNSALVAQHTPRRWSGAWPPSTESASPRSPALDWMDE